MDFKVPDLIVPDWRSPDERMPARPMSEQIWELLEGFGAQAEIGALMQGMAQVDRAIHPDGTFDAEEWRVAAAAMRQGLERRGAAYHPTEKLTTAFEQQIAAAKARKQRP